MNLSELMAGVSKFIGQRIEVEGYFVLVGRDGYFVGSIEGRDMRKSSLMIDVPNLKQVLMTRVPPSGGSKYYYLDEAVVSGRLEKNVDGDFAYRLVEVTALKIMKSGELFVAIP